MKDMTTGDPQKHLISYALPLLLGNWMQLSYNAIDSMIAGKFIGADALAAEGIAGPVVNMAILAVSGLCIGAGVLMSEAFGAKDHTRLRKIMANMVMVGGAVCCVTALAGIVFAPLLLKMLSVPAEIYEITVLYLRITFLGMPFTFCYNALTTGLKSVGDAKTPLKFLAFSAILNAVLDWIFLGILGYGIACSAATTVFAEAVSAGLALWYMLRKETSLVPLWAQWRVEKRISMQILAYGGPTALQQAIQPICKVLIQGQVNTLGVATIATFNAVTRVDDFACIPEQSVSSAISTYIAQNRGAGKKERIRNGFRSGIQLEFLYWMFIGTVAVLLREPIVGMFVAGEESAEVIRLGSGYLLRMSAFYLLPAMTNGMQGFFRGMGKMRTTMMATSIQASIRTICVYWLTPRFTLNAVAYSCAIGWVMMLLFEIPYYCHTCRKEKL